MNEFAVGTYHKFFPDSHELEITNNPGKQIVKLEPLISDLLLIFVNNPDQVTTRAKLIEELWYGNKAVGDPALTKSVFKLRQLFGHEGKKMFETVSKQGYRYNTKISFTMEGTSKSTIFSPSRFTRFVTLLFLALIFIIVIALIIDPKLWHKISH